MRDDLADCFLQGIWYLKREKVIQPGTFLNPSLAK